MTNKQQELELKNIMEGLAEFATFMSYQSDYQGLRILSVETLEEAKVHDEAMKPKAKVLQFPPASSSRQPGTSIYKELKFFDQVVH